MTRNTAGRCLCGIRVTLHFDARNRKRSCAETQRKHPSASVRAEPLARLLRQAKSRT